MGSAIVELLAEKGVLDVPVTRLGLPDRFIEHGSPQVQREDCGLTPGDITQAARDLIEGRAREASTITGHA
jgi:1-deoxy-D-xylulose-5-phosphate synthase